MIHLQRAPLLLFRYCLFYVTLCSAHAEVCNNLDHDIVDTAASSSLIQRQVSRVPQSISIAKTPSGVRTVLQDSGAKQAVSLVSNVASSQLQTYARKTKNATTAAEAIDNPNAPFHHSDGTHHSIFELSFAQLDRTMFWFIFACMLVFTIIVDRIEAWAHCKADDNQKLFLARMNAELMMFGCVGLFLFLLKNLRDLPEDQDVLIEFCDILCSMGAFGVIATAAVLLVVRSLNARHWQYLESVNLNDQSVEATGEVERGFLERLCLDHNMQPMDYQVMAKLFIAKHGLPAGFVYHDYLNQSLCRDACELMDIDWFTWFVMLVIVVVFLVIRVLHGQSFPNLVYVTGFTIVNFLVLVFYILLLGKVNLAHSVLITAIREEQKEMHDAGIKFGHHGTLKSEDSQPQTSEKNPMAVSWSRQIKFFMQLLALFNSFLVSFYILHLQYNLAAANYHWVWRPILLSPLLISLFFMLPFLTSRFTITEAYFSPNGDALDAALQGLNQLDEDLDMMRRMWIAKGRPEFPALDQGVDEQDFAKIFRQIGVHVAKARWHRVFKAIDTDKNGTITTDELLLRLQENPDGS